MQLTTEPSPQDQHKLLWISTPLASVDISVGIWTPCLLAAFLSSPSHSYPVFFPSSSLGIRVSQAFLDCFWWSSPTSARLSLCCLTALASMHWIYFNSCTLEEKCPNDSFSCLYLCLYKVLPISNFFLFQRLFCALEPMPYLPPIILLFLHYLFFFFFMNYLNLCLVFKTVGFIIWFILSPHYSPISPSLFSLFHRSSFLFKMVLFYSHPTYIYTCMKNFRYLSFITHFILSYFLIVLLLSFQT